MANDRFIKHANLMSGLTVLSRVFGLVRDKLWSAYLGLGTEFSAFWMGYQFPNLFRRIFGEGALTAVFVPIYTRILHEDGPEAANKLAAATTTLLVTVLGGLTLLGEMVLIPVAVSNRFQPGNGLAALMLAIMLPYCVLVCTVALFSAIASVHERFTAQSLSPIILNVVTAAAAVGPVVYFTRDYPLSQRICWVAVAVLLAGVLQVWQMMPTLRRSGVELRLLFDRRTPGVSELVRSMLPMIIGFSAVQLNTFMDSQIAWWLSPDSHNNNPMLHVLGYIVRLPLESGALSKLSVAQRIYMLPVGIFGVSMATAIFPQMAKAVNASDMGELKRLLGAGLKKTLFLSLPASAGMILIARPLIAIIYSGPHTTAHDIDRAAWAAVWFSAGIWCFEMQLVTLRVFYALRDTTTPMRTAVAMVILNFCLNMVLVWFLQEGGIALSTTISALIQSGVLLFILRRRLGRLGLGSLRTSVVKGIVASGCMAAATFAVGHWLVGMHRVPAERMKETLWNALVLLPAMVGVAVATYGGMAVILGMPELGDLPVVGRFFQRVMR